MPPKIQLTLEEKKAKKAERKAEKKRRAEEKRIQAKYDFLGREIKYGQLTIKKHERKWRQMLLEIAMPRMRAELEYAWHNFERTIDSKDFTISLLLDEIKESEDQYMRNLKGHMDNIDKLIILCYDQIGDLWKESRQIITNLYNAATFERNDIMVVTKEHEEYLKTMLYMLQNAKKETLKFLRGEYLSKQEVEISKLNDICIKFTEELEANFKDIWNESQQYLKKHIDEYATRKTEFEELTRVDGDVQKLIRKQWNHIRDQLDTIKFLKVRHSELKISQSRKLDELANEHSHYESVYRTVKGRIDRERKMDRENLTLLTLLSNDIMEFLGKIEKKGEKLLTLFAICRKFETIEEKTMAFPDFLGEIATRNKLKNKAVKENMSKMSQKSGIIVKWKSKGQSQSQLKAASTPALTSDEVNEEEQTYMPQLKLFWNRVGETEATRYAMAEECKYLEMENQRLKEKLFQYCECLNCEPHMLQMYPQDKLFLANF